MKKTLFIFCLIGLLASCNKEITDLQSGYFIRFYGDALDDFGVDVELRPAGGYVIAGTTTSGRAGRDTDIMLIMTDEFGYQSGKTFYFGGEGNETCSDLLVLDDGYVIAGSYSNGGIDSVLLIKFGIDGNLLWNSSFKNSGKGLDVALINNQIAIAGYILSQDGNQLKKPMICTFDLQGNSIDLTTPTIFSGDYFTSLINRDNQVIGFGTSTQIASGSDMYIKGVSTEKFSFVLGGNETSSRIIKSAQGGFFMVGTTDPIGSGYNQIIVKKLNNDFSEDLTFNTNPIGSDADFSGVDILEMEDGSLAVLGNKTISKDTDIALFFLNPDGTSKSSKIYGKTGNQSASSFKITNDGGLIIAGSNQQEKTNSMITLIKTDKEGNIWE